MPSPAESYAAAARRPARSKSTLGSFEALYDFPFDPFQVAACEALREGHSVLVAAPTGAGKTVVGEFAVHLALEAGRRCFYTTPIKALSNQKYSDLLRRHGPDRVGLLTGDNSINADAPAVVMTTEVLRNMIYSSPAALRDLEHVVMDEVHYLADRSRGAVWEEVLIHLPRRISVTALSATVSNAEEFGHWLGTVRGRTDVIVEENRPVPLWQHVLVGQHLHDLFTDDGPGGGGLPGGGLPGGGQRGDGHQQVNPELLERAREDARRQRMRRSDRHSRRRHGGGGGRDGVPSRPAVVRRLEHAQLLPAIDFIFSRAGCDAAVEQCLAAGVVLTTESERREIAAEAESGCASLAREDLAALGYDRWLHALERGIAAHHAGLVPVFKEVIESLFQRGLVKCVFATETLALGINMPARSVLLERLVKWNGESHVDLSPGDYTQLTGRAGRRGIDVEGHAVVVWHPGLDPRGVAGLAGTRTYPLRSSFRPSYNMAVNLVATAGKDRAAALLRSSFAQFQADASVVGLSAEIRRNEDGMDGFAEAMRCHLGDFEGYAAIRERIGALERDSARRQRSQRRLETAEALRQLRVGDVIRISRGRRSGIAAVVECAGPHDTDPVILAVDLDRRLRRLTALDFPDGVGALDRIKVRKDFSPRSTNGRNAVSEALREIARALPEAGKARRQESPVDQELTELRAAMRRHQCHGCADRETHARWAERYHRLVRRNAGLEKRVAGRTGTIAKQFDRICGLLLSLGYLAEIDGRVTTTAPGSMLSRIYGDTDLVVAEALRSGEWEGLAPGELASVCAALVYEPRGADGGWHPRLPPGRARLAIERLLVTWGRLRELEAEHGLDTLPEPDLGLCLPMFSWAEGRALDQILRESEMTAGDFVRWGKQVIDLLRQIAHATTGTRVGTTATAAAHLVDRGVVAYSGVHG